MIYSSKCYQWDQGKYELLQVKSHKNSCLTSISGSEDQARINPTCICTSYSEGTSFQLRSFKGSHDLAMSSRALPSKAWPCCKLGGFAPCSSRLARPQRICHF